MNLIDKKRSEHIQTLPSYKRARSESQQIHDFKLHFFICVAPFRTVLFEVSLELIFADENFVSVWGGKGHKNGLQPYDD